MGASHHAQDPGHLAGGHLSHPILADDVSALIQTGDTHRPDTHTLRAGTGLDTLMTSTEQPARTTTVLAVGQSQVT